MIDAWQTGAFRARAAPLAEVVGAKTAKSFAALRIATVGDLLAHLPRRYLAGTELTDLSTLREGEYAAVMARVQRTAVRMGSRQPRLEAVVTDGHGHLNLTFFGRAPLVKYWEAELSKGVRGIFVGKVGSFRGDLQLAHPQFVMLDARGGIVGSSEEKRLLASLSQSGLVGMYPATSKLPTWQIAESVRLALATLEGVADPWPGWVRDEAGVVGLTDAYRHVHQPESMAEVEAGTHRLRFDEAFATQVTMSYRRASNEAARATARQPVTGGLTDAFLARLPYRLTDGQRAVCDEILADLAREVPMRRLLQGEVGSGKTVVALIAMLATVDAGGQAVLLAPTEILATQHYLTITALLGDLGGGAMLGAPDTATDVVLVTGSQPAARRRQALLRAVDGSAGIVVGTHALLADNVRFADLGLVVIDEQHRFGVEQRAALGATSATRPHRLVLTATPIPRSVAMTVFGDLEVSTLTEVPGGRAGVSTTLVDEARRPAWVERAWQRLREEVDAGRQAFVVAPRIDTPADDPEALGVVDLAARLTAGPLAGLRIGVVHGRQSSPDQAEAMAAFVRGETQVLVATTVIEVGVDVANASMMVVTDADRFGISQLHQLRGRIGRGAHPGVCLLLTRAEPGSDAWRRLEAVAATTDGFTLAEIDLEQRREGNVLGSDQSGTHSGLRLLSVVDDADLIRRARDLADRAVAADPDRSTPGFADAVTWIESVSDAEWFERD
nr:ATP-dependent DNA helicase RecG [Propionicicella superfundia]